MRTLWVTTFLLLALAACGAAITPVPYTAHPERIKDPGAELKNLILANTVSGCVAEPDLSEAMLVVKFVCTGNGSGVGNMVVRFGRVETITVEKSGDWYRVLVHHKPGTEDFAWTSKSLEDIERMADAITALTRPNAGTSPAATPTKM